MLRDVYFKKSKISYHQKFSKEVDNQFMDGTLGINRVEELLISMTLLSICQSGIQTVVRICLAILEMHY